MLSETFFDDILEYLGPVAELLSDPTVTEVKLHPERGGDAAVVYERNSRKCTLPDVMLSPNQVDAIARRVAISQSHDLLADPVCYGRFADGSRVTVIAPPESPLGTSVTIRRFRQK